MRAGRLRQVIAIKKPVTGRDAAGGILQTTTTFLSTRAHMAAATGREYWAAEHVSTSYDIVASIRYREGITDDMELHHGSDVYDIKSIVDPTGYKRELKILCVRHV